MRFRSADNPNDVFILGELAAPDYRESYRRVADWVAWHDTMGDGWTAHTPNGPVAAHRVEEFLRSLALALAGRGLLRDDADRGPLLDRLADFWPRGPRRPERLRFLAGLRHAPGLYYHKAEDRTSAAKGCRTNTDWVEVPTWATGNDPGTTYALHNLAGGGTGGSTGIERLCAWLDIQAVTGGRGDLAAFYGDGITRDTPAAVRAVSAFVAARRAEAEALRQLDLHVEGRAAAAAA